MTHVNTTENTILAPSFRDIFLHIDRLLAIRLDLRNHIQPSGNISVETDNVAAAKLIQQMEATQIKLLASLISLADATELALTASGSSPAPVNLVRSFIPFRIAQEAVALGEIVPSRLKAVLSQSNDAHDPGPIVDVLFGHQHNNRGWWLLDLALDLLHYWELFLRHQTQLQCDEFCSGTTYSLCDRIKITLTHDTLTQPLLDPALPVTKPPAIVAIEKDISDRLTRIAFHLTERDILKHAFCQHEPQQFITPEFKRLRRRNTDELSFILSELVHLRDNVAKWLRAHARHTNELSAIETLSPFKVAACYVNTHKHGIRGRKKTTAIVDIEMCIGDANSIVEVLPIINFKGQAWTASSLIDDLLQAWDLFLRYYTDLDTTTFRQSIASRFAARKTLSTYSTELGHTIEKHLFEHAQQRSQFDI